MSIFNTAVFMGLMSFIQSLSSDTLGKIFVLTAISYSTSYMIYSGYISWFAGGYGGLLLSQAGFTAIDFLSLIPTVIVLIAESIWSLTKFLVKLAFYFILLPWIVAFLVALILSLLKIHILAGNSVLASISILAWTINTSAWTIIEISENKFRKYFKRFVIVSIVSILMLFLTASSQLSNTLMIPIIGFQGSSASKPSFIEELFGAVYILIFVGFPFIVGLLLASLAAKGKYLSRLVKLSLKQPISITGANLEEGRIKSSSKRTATKKQKMTQKDDTGLYTYTWNDEQPAYLIASFTRTTALYLPPETISAERGRMILINNDAIYSIEMESKKRDQEDTKNNSGGILWQAKK